MEYHFQPPERIEDTSDLCHSAMQLAALAGRLALEDRTIVAHSDGRAENVSEHSHMLSVVAPAIAEEYYPDLDANLVARFATVHDIVEAYVGDTPTHAITVDGQATKEALEAKGLRKLLDDYAWLPRFCRLVEDYEGQEIPEARFVRVIDKWMPLLTHFNEGGAALKAHFSPDQILANSGRKADELLLQYPEFPELITVRRELAVLATRELMR